MPLQRYAFLIKAAGYDPRTHATSLVSPQFSSTIVGVANLELALEALDILLNQGVQLIELCGGFSDDEAMRLREKAGTRIMIGQVRYSAEEERNLAARLEL